MWEGTYSHITSEKSRSKRLSDFSRGHTSGPGHLSSRGLSVLSQSSLCIEACPNSGIALGLFMATRLTVISFPISRRFDSEGKDTHTSRYSLIIDAEREGVEDKVPSFMG